jgi:hypothetical protein
VSQKTTKTKPTKKSHNSLSANKSIYTSLSSVLLPKKKQIEAPFHALRKKCRGSFTVEAAVALPLFAAFLAFSMFFFPILMVQQNLAEAMELNARKLSAAAFAEQYGISSSAVEIGGLGAAFVKVNKDYQERSNGEGSRYFIFGDAGLSLIGSDMNGDYVTLQGSCAMEFPIAFFGNKTYLVRHTVKARKWTGYAPEGDKAETEEDIWVYITPHGTVYHKERDCTYLKLSTSSVPAAEVGSLRNKDGSRYTPCEICGNRASGSSLVYITDYGTSYHTMVSCSGLKRGIDMIRLKEAEEKGYGACSRCG